MAEEKGRKKENVVEDYDVYKDPDVEFMDEMGMFKEERKRYEACKKQIANQIKNLIIAGVMFLFCVGCANQVPGEEISKTTGITVAEEIASMTATPVPHEFIEKQELLQKEAVEVSREKLVIDGYDFAPYNRGEVGLRDVQKNLLYTEPTLLAYTRYKGIIATISNENLFTMHREYGAYLFFLYIPSGKEVKDVSVGKDFCLDVISDYEFGNVINTYAIYFAENVKGKDIEMPITIKYADDTEYQFSTFITKDF